MIAMKIFNFFLFNIFGPLKNRDRHHFSIWLSAGKMVSVPIFCFVFYFLCFLAGLLYNKLMLKLFRKKIVMKVILWGLVIIIVPAFVMWGGASTSRSKDKGPSYVGIVNGKKISFEDLYNAMSGVRSQIVLNYFNQPKVLDTILADKALMAKLGWDRIIMLAEAKSMKITVGDKEVVEAIRSHPLFVRDGTFDERLYGYILRNSMGLEPRTFEETVRGNIEIQKAGEYLIRDLKLSDEDIANEYKLEFAKIKISYIMLEPKNFINEIVVDDNTAQDFYEKNKSDFMIKSNLKGALPDRQATFEQAKPSIVARLKEVEAAKTLKEKSYEVHKQLLERMEKNGETFEKAAPKMGMETKETDFFSITDNVEAIGNMYAVANAASKLKEFELSVPTETDKGYLIFEIVNKKAGDEEAFKKDKEEYSKKVRGRRMNIAMEGWLKTLEEKAQLAIKLEDMEKELR
jgi:peptidyl-prolyl cis-trans isomerase D